MCGIAGYSGDVPDEVLDAFVTRLHHRGPDARGTWSDSRAQVGLAHTRLSILDLSPRGQQPMVDEATGCRLIYNGEIYNFRALRRDLEARGHRFRSDTDTEVLLRLYLERGAAMLDALDGIFAFALWDPRRAELLLARDALGVKPLYWSAAGGRVLFASEIKALYAVPGFGGGLDLSAVDATLSRLWCPGPRTALAGVSKLEPGTALVARRGEVVRLWRWYELPVETEAARAARPGEHVAEVRAELQRAVHDQLVSDVPVGAFLSGGVDSSGVAAFAVQRAPGLPCFTTRITTGATAAEGFDDDLPHARRVAAHLGAELIEIPIGDEAAGDLEDMVYQLDEPQADLAPLIVRRIAAAARARGIKVLLSGTGGDDLFAGYRRHVAAAYDQWWAWLPQPVRRGLRALSDHVPVTRPTGRRVRKVLRDADLDADARLAAYFEWLPPAERAALYTPDAAAAIAADPYRPLLDSVRRLPSRMHPVNRTAYLDLRYFLPDHNLNYTDKMAMAEGVEVRVPLLARRLVELAATLPIADKVRGGTGKWVLREAVRPLLPDGICDRAKTGFGVPLRGWLHGPLEPLVRDVLSPANLRGNGIFDGAAIERLYQADRAGHIDAAYPLLAIVCVELWARRVGRERAETPRLNAAGV